MSEKEKENKVAPPLHTKLAEDFADEVERRKINAKIDQMQGSGEVEEKIAAYMAIVGVHNDSVQDELPDYVVDPMTISRDIGRIIQLEASKSIE